jgi:ubiquinone biosynthesis protein
MNSLTFLKLIWELYFKKDLPDIEKIQKWGLLAVKIGQIHALRIDFLGPEKCHHLSKLYRQNTYIRSEDISDLIDEYLTRHPDRFESVERTPFAAASVGQVYKAKLITGEDVVLKVIKRNFKKTFSKEVQKVRRLFKVFLFLYPPLKRVGDPIGILNDIEEYTLAELDLRNEVKGQKILKEIKEKHKQSFDLSSLEFVYVFEDLSEENFMVTQYIDAPTFDELLETDIVKYESIVKLFYLHGFYMFIVGQFHGDLHPGNLLYKEGVFYFVDTAYIGTVSKKLSTGLMNFFDGLSKDDFKMSAHWLNKMSEIEIEGVQFENFEKDFLELYKDFGGKTVSEKSLTEQMMQTIKLGVLSGMHFEKGIFAIIRSLMYLDGMVLRGKPDAVILHDMNAFIDTYKEVVIEN